MPRKRELIRWARAEARQEPIREVCQVRGVVPGTHFCGPVAIASITDIDVNAVVNTVQRMRASYKPVTGMRTMEVANVLGRMGYRVDSFDVMSFPRRRCTLNRFWRDRGDNEAATIVEVTGHFVALDWGVIVDTCTEGLYGMVPEHDYARSTVIRYLEVRKLD